MNDYGITSAEDLRRLTRESNDRAERAYAQSSTLTYSDLVVDARDALVGLSADLVGGSERVSLADMVTHENRMRGLGFLCIGVAFVGLFIDYVLT